MVSLLRGPRGALCGRGDRGVWVRSVRELGYCGFALVLALVLCMRTADAQAAAVPSTGVAWGVGAGSSPSSAALSGSSLAITQSLAVTAVLWGVTQVWPVGRVVTAGASVVAQGGRMILQSQMARGALTGTALAAALLLGGSTTYDATSNSMVYRGSDYPSFEYSSGSAAGQACLAASNAGLGIGSTFYTHYTPSGSAAGYTKWVIQRTSDPNLPSPWGGYGACSGMTGSYIWGMNISGNPPAAAPVPATNAQIESAIAATPSSFTNLWSAGGCDTKANTYIDLASLSLGLNGSSDPCAVILVGGSVAPATVPTSNNPYAWPNQVWTDAQPGKTTTHTVGATSTLAANTGVDQKTNPVKMQTAVTDAANDGTNTTTTGTTTTQTKSDTKPDTPAQTTTATFGGASGTLYTKRSQTWAGVLNNFANTVKGAPWYIAATGFFTVSIAGASCPHWAVAASQWRPVALDSSSFFCSSTATTLYALAGAVVLAVAAWAAFRIAFL